MERCDGKNIKTIWERKSIMIRVLQCVNDMHRAGLETMLMNYYRNVDRSQIQFDFLTHRPYRSDYDDEIESMGGKMYYAPRLYPQNYPAYFKWMHKFFDEHPEYTIVHSHIDTMSYVPLLAAKKGGIPVRIAHSHSTSIDKDFKYALKQYYRLKINSVCNIRLACGKQAGEFLFRNKEFSVIPNAIDSSKYLFNQKIREKKRNELSISGEFVIGHVGRFCYPKNHKFLIDIFSEIIKLHSNSLLVLIGTGEKEEEIQKYSKRMGVKDKVLFLGNRSDVNELYQMMDIFVMPSLFEGVPLVGIEAQYADLPCVFSDKIPEEVMFNKKSIFMSLKSTPSEWAKIILEKKDCKCQRGYKDMSSKYDIKNSVNLLSELYMELKKYDNQ